MKLLILLSALLSALIGAADGARASVSPVAAVSVERVGAAHVARHLAVQAAPPSLLSGTEPPPVIRLGAFAVRPAVPVFGARRRE